jgi:hypothetical protein
VTLLVVLFCTGVPIFLLMFGMLCYGIGRDMEFYDKRREEERIPWWRKAIEDGRPKPPVQMEPDRGSDVDSKSTTHLPRGPFR